MGCAHVNDFILRQFAVLCVLLGIYGYLDEFAQRWCGVQLYAVVVCELHKTELIEELFAGRSCYVNHYVDGKRLGRTIALHD